MSGIAGVITACPDIQGMVLNHFAVNPNFGTEISPFLRMLTSELTTSLVQQELSPGRGKIRSLKLIHYRRLLESDATEDFDTNTCPSGSLEANVEFDFDLDTTDNVRSQVESFQSEDVEAMCQDNGQHFTMKLAMLVDQVERKVATKTADSIPGAGGGWDNNVSTSLLSPASTAAGSKFQFDTYDGSSNLRPEALRELKRALQKTGYNNPIGFVGDNIYDYFLDVESGCCTDGGLDIGDMWRRFGIAVAYDSRVADALGNVSTQGIITQPGAFALGVYLKSPWRDSFPAGLVNAGSNYFSFAITSPTYGLPMDVYMKDDCGTLTMWVVCTTTLFAAPSDLYKVGDPKEDVNMINYIEQV